MDNQQPAPPVSQPAVSSPNPPQIQQKSNNTVWIILSLLLVAVFLTGVAYIFIPQFTGKKNLNTQKFLNNETQESISLSPTPVDTVPKFETYSNTKYAYSFLYPSTWTVAKTDADEKNIELHYVASPDLAIIHIEYLSAEERAKIPQIYCETSNDTKRCNRYRIPNQIDALIDSDYSEKTSKDEALVSLSANDGTLRIRTTDTNAESKSTFWEIIFTLKSLFCYLNYLYF